MPSDRLKIQVNCLRDMHDLLAGLASPQFPSDVYLPLRAYNCIHDRAQPTSRGIDERGKFVYFEGVRIRPPNCDIRIIDLSNAEVIDAPS